jgi:translation initiation factor IF-2
VATRWRTASSPTRRGRRGRVSRPRAPRGAAARARRRRGAPLRPRPRRARAAGGGAPARQPARHEPRRRGRDLPAADGMGASTAGARAEEATAEGQAARPEPGLDGAHPGSVGAFGPLRRPGAAHAGLAHRGVRLGVARDRPGVDDGGRRGPGGAGRPHGQPTRRCCLAGAARPLGRRGEPPGDRLARGERVAGTVRTARDPGVPGAADRNRRGGGDAPGPRRR